MPEPLTTLWKCPECGSLDQDQHYTGNHDFDRNPDCWKNERVPVPVFSAGDMQAAREEVGRLEQVVEAAHEQQEGVGQLYVETRDRAAVVAEALRDLLATHQGSSNEAARARRKAQAALEGVDRSHELVPLGTQEALVELVERVVHVTSFATAGVNDHLLPALARARALVEGVERTPVNIPPQVEEFDFEWAPGHHTWVTQDVIAEVLRRGMRAVPESSEGHTLVPNGVQEVIDRATELITNRGHESNIALSPELASITRNLVATSRGGRPQWPGTGETT